MNPPNRKRKRWQDDLPAFLDAASAVSATSFGARRLPELKALWAQVRFDASSILKHIDEPLRSSGHKTSSRHLRRRTTSYLSRKRHRYPDLKPADVSSPNTAIINGILSRASRKSRRKPAQMRADHFGWQQSNDVNESRKIFWMTTHLWHAKRFHMKNMFGWKVPLLHTNRGCRAVHRLIREGRSTLQDVTWRMQPIKLSVVQDLKVLIEFMKTICPTFETNCLGQAVLDGKQFGTGVLYEPKAFPAKAIGPAIWWIRRIDLSNGNMSHQMYLFLHPSIQPQLKNVLKELNSSSPSLVQSSDVVVGVACFQIQGESVARLVSDSLKMTEDDFTTIVSVEPLCFAKLSVGMVSTQDSSHHKSFPFGLKSGQIMLARQEAQGSKESAAWYLMCSVSDAPAVFLALSRHPLSVPIGYVEETQLSLLLNLPSAMFPAAYPDCEEGRKYWEGNSDWQVFRSMCESGHGRVQFTLKPKDCDDGKALMIELSKLASLVDSLDENEEALPVVVRGAFGLPFVNLIQQCARPPLMSTSEPNSKQRRNRRKILCPKGLNLACRISDNEAQIRVQHVMSLASSLSFATLIRCKVVVRGRGTLSMGDSIYGCSRGGFGSYLENPCYIGVMVYGSFSSAQGSVEGFGFVAASKLLLFLKTYLHPAMIHDKGALSLVVQLKRATATTTRTGVLSLLL